MVNFDDIKNYGKNGSMRKTVEQTVSFSDIKNYGRKKEEDEKEDSPDGFWESNSESVLKEINDTVTRSAKTYEDYYASFSARFGEGADSSAFLPDTKEWSSKTTDLSNSLMRDYATVNSLVTKYSEYLDADSVKSIRSMYENILSNSRLFSDTAKNSQEYWSQWGTEDEYNSYLNKLNAEAKDEAEVSRLKGLSSEEVKQELSDREKQTDEDKEILYTLQTTNVPFDDSVPYSDEAERIRIKELRQYVNDKYGINPEEHDYISYQDAITKAANSINAYTDGNGQTYTYPSLYYSKKGEETVSEFDNLLKTNEGLNNAYSSLNNEKMLLEKAKSSSGNSMHDNNYFKKELTKLGIEYDEYGTWVNKLEKKIADDEKQFVRSVKSTGLDYDLYAEYSGRIQRQNEMAEQLERTAEAAKKHPIAATVAAETVGLFSAIPEAISTAVSGKNYGKLTSENLDSYTPIDYTLAQGTAYSQTVESTISKKIEEDVYNATGSNLVSWLLSNGYSGIVSGASSKVLGLATTAILGPVLGEAATLALMGTRSAVSAMTDAAKSGKSNAQIVLYGLANGINEAVFEKVSLDKFLNADFSFDYAHIWTSLKDMALNGLAQAAVEGSEEIATDFANSMADAVINGDLSDYKTNIRSYINQGYSEADATSKANEDFIMNSLASFYGGFVGGFGSTGARTAVMATEYGAKAAASKVRNSLVENRYYKAVGNEIQSNDKVNELITEAKASEDKNAQKLAAKVEAKTNAKKNVSSKDVGKLAVETYNDAGTTEADAIKNETKKAIKTAIEEKKFTATDKKMKVVQKIMNNEQLSASEQKLSKAFGAEEIANTVESQKTDIEAKASKAVREATIKQERIEGYVDKQNAALQERLHTSEDNSTQIKSTGEAVEVKNIVSNTSRGMEVELTNGEKVNINELTYGTEREAIALESLRTYGYDAQTSNVLNELSKNIETDKVADYLEAANQVVMYGYSNYGEENVNTNILPYELSESEVKTLYNLGVEASNNKINAQAQSVQNLQNVGTKNKGRVVFTNSARGLNYFQKQQTSAIARATADIIHNNVVIYKSEIKNGRHVMAENIYSYKKNDPAPNGFYDSNTGTIYLDANAGNGGEGVMMYTFAHETTHFAAQWASEDFKKLGDFLISQYAEKNVDINALVQGKINRARRNGRVISETTAYEEVVADSMERMFVDNNALEKLEKLRTTDRTVWEKIVDYIGKLIDNFKKVYEQLSGKSTTVESDIVSQMGDAIDKLSDLYAKAVYQAGENFEKANINISQEEVRTLAENGISVDAETGDVLSVRYVAGENGIPDLGTIAKLISKQTGRSLEDSLNWAKSEFSLANIILKESKYLDYQADERYEFIKKNSDYPQGTVDPNNLCVKREELTTMFDLLQKTYPDRVFTATEVAEMRQILIDNDIIVNCGACFVEDRRQLLGEIAETFKNMWQTAVESGKPLQKTNAKGELVTMKVTKTISKQYGMKQGSTFVAYDKYIPNQYDITTYEGFKELEKNHPTIAAAFVAYNNSRGQQAARLIEGRSEYKRQILEWNDAKVKKVNNEGGLRLFSFSDFQAVSMIDIVQVVIDCSARGVKIQGYTKVPAFARLVRNTGIKLNRSLMPKGENGYHIENGKKVLDYDTVEGIDINDKDFLDEKDNPNIGNILVGINADQIGLAFTDDFVDYIIPFHSNKARAVLHKLGLATWENYKESQHEKDIDTGTSSKKNVNIYTQVIDKYNPTNKTEFVNAFLEECRKQKKIPRYSQFLNKEYSSDGVYHDEGGAFNYTYREGYHKLLIDFKMFDKNGNILPQQNVTPDFGTDGNEFMTQILYNEVDRKTNYTFPQEVFDKVENALNGDETMLSERDSDGDELSSEQQKFFKDSKVRDEDGNLRVVYHGTEADFTVFDSTKSRANMDIQGNFFSPWEIDAGDYGSKVNAYYLNIKNPASEGIGYKALNKFKGQNNVGVKAREYLISLGYDGVNNGDEEYIAFYPEQIKRIDNKKPTENVDVRYSERDTDATDKKKETSAEYLKRVKAEYRTDTQKRVAQTKLKYQEKLAEQKLKYEQKLYEKDLTFNDKLDKQEYVAQFERLIAARDKKEATERIKNELTDYYEGKISEEKLKRAQQKYENELNLKNVKDRYAYQIWWIRELDNIARKEYGRDLVAKYRQTAENAQLRTKIRAIADDFRKRLLNSTDTKYVPKDLVNGIISVCETIDPTGERQDTKVAEKYRTAREALVELKMQYDALKDDSNYEFSSEYNEEFSKKIKELADSVGNTPVRDMTSQQLEDVYNILHDIKAMLTDATKQIGTSEKITNYQAGSEIIALMQNIKAKKLTTNDVSSFFRNWTENPMRAVRELSAFDKNSRLVKLFEDLDAGRRKADTFKMEVTKRFEELRKTKEDRKNFNDAVEKPFDFGLTDINGNKLKISKMQAMQIVLTWEREQANNGRKHLQTGAKIPDVDLQRKGNYQKALDKGQLTGAITPDKIVKIMNGLSEWDNRYLETARWFFNEKSKNAINETSMLTRHRIVASEKKYIPYEVDKDYIKSESENVVFNGTIDGMGILKSVKTNAPQQLVIGGLNGIVSKHTDQVSKIYGLSVPVRNFKKAFNMQQTAKDGGKSVKAAIGETWGKAESNLIEQAVADLESKRPGGNLKFLQMLRSGQVAKTLASNISVVIKQFASYPTAGYILSEKSLDKGLYDYVTRAKDGLKAQDIWNEIDEHTSQHWIRRQGLSTQELGEINQSHGWENKLNQKLGSLSPMNWIQDVDVFTTAALWCACKEEVQAKGINQTDESYWNEVTKLYDQVIEETQPMYDSLHRAEITKQKELQNIILFQTQPIQNSGILREGGMEYKMAKKQYGAKSEEAKAAGKKYVRAVVSQIKTAALFTALTLAASAFTHRMNPYRDDDDEVTPESIALEYGKGVLKNFFAAEVPVFGNMIVSAEEKFFEGSSYDVMSDFVVDSINSTFDAFANMKNPTPDNIRKLACNIAGYFGIPADNAYKLGNGIKLHIEDIANGEFLSFEAGVERNASQKARVYINSIESGNTVKAKATYNEWLAEKKQDIIVSREEDGKQPLSEADLDIDARSAIKTSISSQFKQQYIAAKKKNNATMLATITKTMASTELFDKNDLHWTYKEWDYIAKNGDSYGYDKYSDIMSAVMSGDDAKFKSAMSEFTTYGYEQKTVQSTVKGNIKTAYSDGEISTAEAEKKLVKYCGVASDKAHWVVDEWNNSDNEDYSKYDDIVSAALSGNKAKFDSEMKEFTQYGYEEDSVINTIVSELKSRFKSGEENSTAVTNALVKYAGKTDDEAYWLLKEWSYKGEGYKKYGDFYNAVQTGKNIKEVIAEYTSHGVATKTLASEITSYFKPIYKAASKSERSSLQGYLLNAYALLGYDKTEKKKDIEKWLEN